MNDEEELFAERNEFNFESKLIRNDNKNIFNRLCSIVDDADFVMKVADIMPDLALIANERCGSWYINRTKRKAYSAYFKSTDGHVHIWDFNIRRNNLHLIPILMSHGGCLVVDSTRKGKRIPDALSKTIPIWCCTVNRAVAKYAGTDWDLELHTLPSAVSRSEHAQIEAKLDGFVDKLLTSGVDMERLKNQLVKPLRPIWFTPQSYDALIESPPDFQDASFCPVVCLSASEAVQTGYQSRPGYLYVQGSADDEEAWAFGLTHLAFWKHRHDLLANSNECERNVKSLVALLKDNEHNNNSDDDDDDDGTTKHFAFIKSTSLAIGDGYSGKPPRCWNTFDYVINCCQDEYKLNQQHGYYLHLPIPDGKKGQIVFGSSIQKAIDFVHDPIMGDKKILIYCATGKDYSVGILLSIMIQYFTLEFQLKKITAEKPRVDKKTIQHQLVQIISSWEKAAPSRVTLKRINTHFMSHSSHDNAE